jgi:hypothetical protein
MMETVPPLRQAVIACCAKTRPKRDSRKARHYDVAGEPSALRNLQSRTTIQTPFGTDAHLHQGLSNELIAPKATLVREGPVRCRERLGGVLRFYYRAAA